MGFWSSIDSTISSVGSDIDRVSTEIQEAQRKKNGFKNFSADMEKMRNYDPAAEFEMANAGAGDLGLPIHKQVKKTRKSPI